MIIERRLKVVVLTEGPEIAASARANAYQYVDYLREFGVDMDVWPSCSSRTYRKLQTMPARAESLRETLRGILKRYILYIQIPATRLHQILRARRYDLVVVQRNLWYHRAHPVLERLLRRVHQRLIYHLDDALFVVDPYALERIRLADAVWTGNEHTAARAREYNCQVQVIETGVDTTRYYHPKEIYEKTSPIVIGWVGTPYNFRHLDVLEEAIHQLSRQHEIQFRVVSSEPFHFPHYDVDIDFREWTLESEVSNILDLDIGLMPLLNDEYSMGKEGFKIKQYMACAIPVVASPVGYNNTKLIEDRVNGFLASNTEEWIERISILVQSSESRKSLGQAGHETVTEHYTTQEAAARLARFFWEVYRTHPQPGSSG